MSSGLDAASKANEVTHLGRAPREPRKRSARRRQRLAYNRAEPRVATMSILQGLGIEEVRAELSNKPLRASSRGRDWCGVAVDQFGSYLVEDMVAPPRNHHALTVCLGDSPSVVQMRCGSTFTSASRIGQASIIPGGFKSRWRGRIPEAISFRFLPDVLTEASAEARKVGAPTVEIKNGFRLIDPAIAHFGSLFQLELSRRPHPTQVLVAESMALALILHLLRGYTDATGVEPRSVDTTGSGINRAVAYIEDHPARGISLEELAQASGLSRFHFSRMFKQALGVTPSAYVERARIERAKDLIRNGSASLAEVAQEVGFADQSHFTRRFKGHVGCTPAVYAEAYGRRASRH